MVCVGPDLAVGEVNRAPWGCRSTVCVERGR